MPVERGLNAGEYDVSFYLSLAPRMGLPKEQGYVVEVHPRPGETGVSFEAGDTGKPGEPLRYHNHVVMSCPLKFKRMLDEFGDNDAVGQRGANELAQAFRRTGSFDPEVKRANRNGIRLQRDPRSGAVGDTWEEESTGEEEPGEPEEGQEG